MVLDACIPHDTRVLIAARTAEDPEELDLAEWQEQPRLHLRGDGADLPFHQPFEDMDPKRAGVWELLLQRQRGRWLELRVTLLGNGRASRLVRALRVWRPRFSYLDEYLPAIYRQDPEAADFLERWLANFEGLFTGIEGRVANAERFLDPDIVPQDALDWLGQWLGVEPGTAPGRLAEPARRRLLIANAHLLWDWRGTPKGLLILLRLALDECVDDSLFDSLALKGGLGALRRGRCGSGARPGLRPKC